MTDIHAHILPGVDDGPRTLEDAKQMLRSAADRGTRQIVATPHSDLRYTFNVNQCRALIKQLEEGAPERIRVLLGCEVHLTVENIRRVIADPASHAIGGGDCLLLELPDAIVPAMCDPAIEALTDGGLRIIVAHPERNPYIQKHLAYADKLVDNGCFLQLTARSLTGGFGRAARSTADYLLKRRLAHFVSSDAHGVLARRPGLAAAFNTLCETHGRATAETLLIGNPEAAVTGSPIRQIPARASWLSTLFSRTSNVFRKHAVPQLP
jgi:protein-tyrosine phosphatase